MQVFDRMGNHISDILVPTEHPNERGSAWWVASSPDESQRYLYVMNGGQERVHIIDRESGETLSTFGRPGHYIGNFAHGHKSRPSPEMTDGDDDNLVGTNTVVDSVWESRD